MLLVRRNIFKNKKRLVPTVLALSFGVALLVSIQSAIHNTKNKFSDVMNSEISNADLVIQSISYGLIEDDLNFLDKIDNVKSPFTRIELKGIAWIGESSCYINLVGGKLDKERETNSFTLKAGALPEEGQILIPNKLQEEYGLDIKDQIEIELENGKAKYQISGVIEMKGIASKQNGIICLLPLDTTRKVLNTDKESLVNVILRDSRERDQTVKAIEKHIGDSTTVYYPERKNQYYMDTLEGFFLGLNIFSLVVISAAGFIIYNTISKFVSEKKSDIAILKVLGSTKKKLIIYILAQTVILYLVSLIVGVTLGIFLSGAVTSLVMQSAVGTSYVSMNIVSIGMLIKDALFVLLVTLIASIAPAIKGSVISIIDGLSTLQKNEKDHNLLFYVLISVSLMCSVLVVKFGKHSSLYAYSLILFAILISYSSLYLLLVPVTRFISKFLISSKKLYAKSMVRTNLLGCKFRTTNTIFSCGICLALTITILGLSSGFETTLSDWMNSMNQGDIVAYARTGFKEENITNMKQDKNIVQVVENYSNIMFDNGNKVEIEVVSLDNTRLTSKYFKKYITYDKNIEGSFENSNQIIVSKKLADQLCIGIGNTYTLETELGQTEFVVVGLTDSFLSDENKCYMSIENFKKFYSNKKLTMVNLYVKKDLVSKDIINVLSNKYRGVDFTLMSDEIQASKDNITNNLFTTFYALVFVALLVSGLCLMNSMNMFVMDRVYQLSVLKSIGMSKKHLKRLIFLQGEILGGLCIVLGIGLGIVLQYIAIEATEIITGWKVAFHINIYSIVAVFVLGYIITICASVLPAISSYKISVIEVLRRGEN